MQELPQLLANFAGLGVRLLGQIAGRLGETVLDRGQRGLDAADDLLDGVVDVPVVRGDFTKLHEATGWEPRLSLDETLLDVLEQWSERAA